MNTAESTLIETAAPSDQAPLNIAMLAPPWISVPPPAYGGVEQVLELLSGALTRRGHRVTLFAAPGSRSEADVQVILDHAHPDEIQMAIFEADHVARSFDRIDAAASDGDALRRRPRPLRLHRAGVRQPPAHAAGAHAARPVHRRHALVLRRPRRARAHAIALSEYQARQAPPELRVAAVIANPIVVDAFPFRADDDGYLLWIGRFNDDKGPQRAIAAARRGRHAADPRRPRATGPGGVLRLGGATAHRRRARALRRRARRGEEAAVRRRRGAADADPLARAVRPRDDRGDGLRHAGDRVRRGIGLRDRRRRRDRLRRRGRGTDGGRDRPPRRDRPAALPRQRRGSASTSSRSPPPTSGCTHCGA